MMEKYYNLLLKIKEEQENEIDNSRMKSLAERMIREITDIVDGEEYGFQDGLYFTTGKMFLNPGYKKTKVFDADRKEKIKKLYIFVDSIEEKVRIQVPSRVEYEIVFVGLDRQDKYRISIDSRLNNLLIKTSLSNDSTEPKDNPENTIVAIGELYIAKIYDLIQMYNIEGDRIFNKNVRCRVTKDVTGVGAAILDTLEKNPEQFWLLNNGITMLVNGIEKTKKDSIAVISSNGDDFSIINGAQTISTCADFFYGDKYSDDAKNRAKDSAFVILRLMSIKGENEFERNRLETKISVSLNRQKPIDGEDLAYNIPVVQTINNLELESEKKDLYFKIARKGENYINEHSYTLVQIGKYQMAAKLQRPGSARNAYSAYLVKSEGAEFKNHEVFPGISMNYKRKDVQERQFIENYGLVNYADKLQKIWDNNKDIIDKYSTQCKAFMDGGNYYFISFMTWCVFGKKEFKGSQNVIYIKNDKVNDVLQSYSSILSNDGRDIMISFCKLMNEVLDSRGATYNDTKKNDIYDEIEPDLAAKYRQNILDILNENKVIQTESMEASVDEAM